MYPSNLEGRELAAARVPGGSADYWREFPNQVELVDMPATAVDRRASTAAHEDTVDSSSRPSANHKFQISTNQVEEFGLNSFPLYPYLRGEGDQGPLRPEHPVLAGHKYGLASTMARKDAARLNGVAVAGIFLHSESGHSSDLDLPSFDRLPVKTDLDRPESVITTSSIVSSEGGEVGSTEGGEIGAAAPHSQQDVYTISGLYGGNVDHLPCSDSEALVRTHKRSTSTQATSIVLGIQMTHKRSHSHTVGYSHKRTGSNGFALGHRRTASGALVDVIDKITGGAIEAQTTTELLQSIQKQQQERKMSKQELEELEDDFADVRDCGYLSCRPLCAQPLASIKVFVLLLSSLVTLQQALSSGYLNSVITTIEKRYEIPSKISGFIASMYEIGNVFTVIFVSYLGSRRNIPSWIGCGVLVMGLGSIIFSLPHFISESYHVGFDYSDENVCKLNPSTGQSTLHQHLQLRELTESESSSLPSLSPEEACTQGSNSKSQAVSIFIFMVAQLFLGCGGSPLLTLGTAYIDNHVKREAASVYIGFVYSMVAFGPVLGFLLGGLMLEYYVDTFSGDAEARQLDSDSRHWIGMWWGGFLIIGCLIILISIPFFAFPKELKREKRKIFLEERFKARGGQEGSKSTGAEELEPSPAEEYGNSIKDLPRCIWRLLTNWVYMVACIGSCMELVIVSGFVVFLPKYLETQFSIGKSKASVLTGGTAIPGAVIGIFLGGYIIKRLKLQPLGAIQMVLMCNLSCLCCYGLLFVFGCNNAQMAGVNTPYSGTLTEGPFQIDLNAGCNLNCGCNRNDMQPVCGSDGLTYFSPCLAGCDLALSNDTYTDCDCVEGKLGDLNATSSSVARLATATAGPCNTQCEMMIPFLVLLFCMTLMVALTQMPLLMIVLRSVGEEEKSFALGIQFVIFRLFGYIPSPIMFGGVIDSTCTMPTETCDDSLGNCLLYDIELFRYKYVGICGGIKGLAFLIFLFCWYLLKRGASEEKEAGLASGDLIHSVVSVEKLYELDNPGCTDLEEGGGDSSLAHTNLSPTRHPMILEAKSK